MTCSRCGTDIGASAHQMCAVCTAVVKQRALPGREFVKRGRRWVVKR